MPKLSLWRSDLPIMTSSLYWANLCFLGEIVILSFFPASWHHPSSSSKTFNGIYNFSILLFPNALLSIFWSSESSKNWTIFKCFFWNYLNWIFLRIIFNKARDISIFSFIKAANDFGTVIFYAYIKFYTVFLGNHYLCISDKKII